MAENKDALVETLKRESEAKQKEIDKLKGKALKKAASEDVALEGFSGQYKDLRTGDIVALKVVENHQANFGRTHLVRGLNTAGDYTAADFRRLFDKL